jgi:hypothetical protein
MITCTAGFEFAIDKQRALAVASFGSQRVPSIIVPFASVPNDALTDFDHKISGFGINDPTYRLRRTVAFHVVAFRSDDRNIEIIEPYSRFKRKIAQSKAVERRVGEIDNIDATVAVHVRKAAFSEKIVRTTDGRVKTIAGRIEKRSTISVELPFGKRCADNGIQTRRPATGDTAVVTKTADRLLIAESTNRQPTARRRRRRFRLRCATCSTRISIPIKHVKTANIGPCCVGVRCSAP